MLKVYTKDYSLTCNANKPNSFAEALSQLCEDINSSGRNYTVLHTENEKHYELQYHGDSVCDVQIGGTAVVMISFDADA